MLILIQFLLIAIFVTILLSLYVEEKRYKTLAVTTGQLSEFWDDNERRQTVRLSKTLEVRYKLKKRVSPEFYVKSRDISTGGIRISTCEKLIMGAILSIDLSLPALEAPVTVEGEVIWVNEAIDMTCQDGKRVFDVGVKFVNVKPKLEAVLSRYIREALTKK